MTHDLYLSTSTIDIYGRGEVKMWRVIFKGIPTMADTEDFERAKFVFKESAKRNKKEFKEIPVWHGDEGIWGTLPL